MNPEIIYEDKSLMVLNKPAGWITNESASVGERETIQRWLAKNFDFETVGIREYRDGVVHRLDKETSGILLVAKTKSAFEFLQALFKSREVQKTYVALVHGVVEPSEGKIEIAVGRLPWRKDRFGVLPGGRESVTEYKVIDYYMKMDDRDLKADNENRNRKLEVRSSNINAQSSHSNFYPQSSIFSLVELSPKTGRTHQIRIHMKYLGHPLVSDEFYAGRKTARKDRKWCPRLFLHASEIVFTHPGTLKEVSFKSDLPKDLKVVLSLLR